MKKLTLSILFILSVFVLQAQGYGIVENISYRENAKDAYQAERCKLDVYFPAGVLNNYVVVWFHGGGLVGGEKHVPDELREQGVCVVTVNYRLSPHALCPAYIEDAAAAVAWTKRNIWKYGGDPEKIVVAGHSAGGYLALMLALDSGYLGRYGIDAANDIVSYYPISGQCVTHNAVREEMGLDPTVPYVDRYAPLYHVTAHTAPIVLVCGEDKLELARRVEENYSLWQALQDEGNTVTKYYSFQGCDHGTCAPPALRLLVEDLGPISVSTTK